MPRVAPVPSGSAHHDMFGSSPRCTLSSRTMSMNSSCAFCTPTAVYDMRSTDLICSGWGSGSRADRRDGSADHVTREPHSKAAVGRCRRQGAGGTWSMTPPSTVLEPLHAMKRGSWMRESHCIRRHRMRNHRPPFTTPSVAYLCVEQQREQDERHQVGQHLRHVGQQRLPVEVPSRALHRGAAQDAGKLLEPLAAPATRHEARKQGKHKIFASAHALP